VSGAPHHPSDDGWRLEWLFFNTPHHHQPLTPCLLSASSSPLRARRENIDRPAAGDRGADFYGYMNERDPPATHTHTLSSLSVSLHRHRSSHAEMGGVRRGFPCSKCAHE
uniref:Uncharacterized protein n=1 Tax=Xiphophorus couchianus TaxID=32473 RepID=A0A3B5M7Z2_9TELE